VVGSDLGSCPVEGFGVRNHCTFGLRAMQLIINGFGWSEYLQHNMNWVNSLYDISSVRPVRMCGKSASRNSLQGGQMSV
jgi:hypothetical protein